MQDRVNTSFIPKTSLQVERKKSAVQTSFGIINTIAVVVLIASIIAAGVMFGFEQYVKASIERKGDSLERARAAFEPKTIEELVRLDSRLSLGAALLETHLAPSYLFEEIEAITLESVRFRDFGFIEESPGVHVVTMSGEARSFNALALQSDAFGNSDFFEEAIFDGLNINETGNVIFSFKATVDTALLGYRGRTPSLPNVQVETTPSAPVVPTP